MWLERIYLVWLVFDQKVGWMLVGSTLLKLWVMRPDIQFWVAKNDSKLLDSTRCSDTAHLDESAGRYTWRRCYDMRRFSVQKTRREKLPLLRDCQYQGRRYKEYILYILRSMSVQTFVPRCPLGHKSCLTYLHSSGAWMSDILQYCPYSMKQYCDKYGMAALQT